MPFQRTKTSHLNTLTFPSGLTIALGSSPKEPRLLKFAAGSNTDTGLHWHETHDEFFSLNQGVAKLILENERGAFETHYLSPLSGTVTIPRFRRHCLGRGDAIPISPLTKRQLLPNVEDSEWAKDLLVQEWTEPRDDEKEIFFRNLAGVVNEPVPQRLKTWAGEVIAGWIWGFWVMVQVFLIFGVWDNYPAIFGGKWGGVERKAVRGLCWGAGLLGGLVGYKGVSKEYMPVGLGEGRKGK